MFSPVNHLWYTWSARTWNEALALGNGRIGAMVYGGAAHETIKLNEDTLWSGRPGYCAREGAKEAFFSARNSVMKGDNLEAERTLEDGFTGLWSQLYLPLGDITLSMEHDDVISEYIRSLDLSTGVHSVRYVAYGIGFMRTAFFSAPDQVLVLRIEADRPNAVSVRASLNGAMRVCRSIDHGEFYLEGDCPTFLWHYGAGDGAYDIHYGDTPESTGIGYRAVMRLLPEGNAAKFKGSGAELRVQTADAVTLLFAVRTSFAGYDKHPCLEGREYKSACLEDLNKAASIGYERLLDRHIRDHRALYDRFSLDLGGGSEGNLPTDERLYAHENGGEDKALYVLMFNFARYLTIAGSRPGTQPMTLQGIWNDLFTAPWHSNYTLNINTEMNYWPTHMVGLSECAIPLYHMLSDLAASGERTAREWFGTKGFTVFHNTDIWRMSTSIGAAMRGTAVWGQWPFGSGWLLRSVYDAYEYTRDADFLRRLFPIIQKCADFYVSLLFEDTDGHLIFGPISSPENTFLLDGKPCCITKTNTMGMAIIRDVLTIYREAATILKEEWPYEKELSLLKPFQIGSDGRLLEWSEELPEVEIDHRHASHMWPLYPGHFITPDYTPELAEACRKSLVTRGDDGTGWALGWKINCWARLRDGDHALKLMDTQLRTVEGRNPARPYRPEHGGGTFLNLFDAHPPFQIDGNFAFCSGVCEMLLQVDSDGKAIPLAALPSSWKDGAVRGLHARNGHIYDITWKDGSVVELKEY